MHNLHLIGVVADDGEEATTRALYLIEDWGSEDNWRVACGAIDAGGAIYTTGEGRWEPSDWLGSPEKIREAIQQDIVEKLNLEINTEGKTDIDDYIAADNLRARSDAKWSLRRIGDLDRFDPFNPAHEYRAGSYDQFGISHFDDALEGKRWLVLIDMHS